MKQRPPTSDQLRDDIDRGRSGDKIAAGDPAAAPLGTDDEAGGAPPTAAQRRITRAEEAKRGARTKTPGWKRGYGLLLALAAAAVGAGLAYLLI